MIGFWIVLAGVCLVALAWVIAINTSMGGTRSDSDDGSGTLCQAGAWTSLIGLVVFVLEQIQ